MQQDTPAYPELLHEKGNNMQIVPDLLQLYKALFHLTGRLIHGSHAGLFATISCTAPRTSRMQTPKAALRNTPSSPRSFSQLALRRVICIPLVYR